MCGRLVWFRYVNSTSLTVHGELNHIIVAPHHMFTSVDQLSWVNVGGWCYRVVLEDGSSLGLDGQCVGHAYMSISYVLFMLVVYVLILYALWWSWLQLCRHVKFDVVVCVVVTSVLCIGYAC